MNDQGRYQPFTYYQLMETSLRELLVAKAWVDADYRKRLLANGTKACEELGLQIPGLNLVVVENTPQVHNAIVCTLCSCYPRVLLGIPPDWYKSRNYRSRMVREPRVVLAEFGLSIADTVQIRVCLLYTSDAADERSSVD